MRSARSRRPSTSRRMKRRDRKSTRLNSSHGYISYAVFCLKKKKKTFASRTAETVSLKRFVCRPHVVVSLKSLVGLYAGSNWNESVLFGNNCVRELARRHAT